MVELVSEHASGQNRRFVARLDDGAAVEAVLYRGDSLCVSCQVGCAVGCPFCASGARGLMRPLSLEELVGQVEAIRALGASLRRVTVSGVGEPLHNRAVLPILDWCRKEPHNGLTVSVHAGTEPVRARSVPKGPPLSALFDALADEIPKLSNSRRKKIALAYLLVADLNEEDAEIDAFVARVAPLGLWVHLYAYNPVPTSGHRPVGRERYEAVYRRMSDAGLRVRMSCQARVEANGGCGTLVGIPRVDRVRADMR